MNGVRFIKAASLVCTLVTAVSLLAIPARQALAQTDNILLYHGADRQQKLIAGAKREGEVNVYTALVANVAGRPLINAFMRTYPFVKVNYLREDSEGIVTKVSAEERAHRVLADVIEGSGVHALAVAAKIVQPFYSPIVDQYPKQYRDPRGLSAVTRVSYFSLAYNTRLVPRNKVPQSYEDLLDPIWRGKMAWRVGSASGTPMFITNLRLAWGEQRAMAYFHKLAKQHLINFGSGSSRTLVNRVVAGDYPIALNVFAHFPLVSAAKGAPVNSKLLAPVPCTPSSLLIPKNLPHPYAAMLFADFMLSKAGQEVLSKAGLFSARSDVAPLPLVARVDPKIAGVPVDYISAETLQKYTASSEKIYENLFR